MAGLRRVFDHPRLLADDSSLWRAVACAASFIASLALRCAVASVDGDVGRSRAGHVALARRETLPRRLDLGRGHFNVCLRTVYPFAIREEFQREATRRASGGSWQESRAAAGHRWNPVTGPASGVPRASVRDDGMERGNRTGGLLGTDGVRCGHGRGADPDGGCGVVETVLDTVSSLSRQPHHYTPYTSLI